MTIELEYEILRPGLEPVSPPEYSWEEVVIGIRTVEPLIGYKVRVRPVDPLGTPGFQYPAWELIEQTITVSKPDCGVQVYGGVEGEYLGAQWSEGGIDDDSGYVYTETFDHCGFYYLPAFSGDKQTNFTGEISATDGFPEEPYDPENDIYPMDAVTRFLPDDRQSLVITYTVETKYSVLYAGPQWFIGYQGPIGPQYVFEDTITIHQVVKQPSHNWGADLHSLIQKTYFHAGIYH